MSLDRDDWIDLGLWALAIVLGLCALAIVLFAVSLIVWVLGGC